MSVASVGAQIEADEIGYWFHLGSPVSNWLVYEVLVGGLQAAKRDYRDAVAAHDQDRQAAALREVNDLTVVCAAAADGLAAQRARFLSGDHLWPLVPLGGG